MSVKSFNNGREIILKNDKWVYVDSGEEITSHKCPKCNQYQNNSGHDFCIQNLGYVINACCGHGKQEGYIQFDNGITIRGNFKIEIEKR